MKRVVLYSGGLMSWAVAEAVLDEHGESDMVLLFTDTVIECADLYRFLDETSEAFGIQITRLAEGRTPWEVFHDEGMMGNTRVDPCSRILKREPTRKWLNETCDPESTVVYLGFDMFEDHRLRRARPHWLPWHIEAPLVERIETRATLTERLRERWGIEPPRMYAEGFSHNNCGGFCVKAGLGHFAHLLRVRPEVYAHHEAQEERFRRETGKDVSILRDQSGGDVTPLTLRELRRRIEESEQPDMFADAPIGGCGCFSAG